MNTNKLILCAASMLLATGALAADQFRHTDFTQPDFFPILPWDPGHGWDGKATDSTVSGLETVAECGFNFAGFVTPEDLPRCRELGLAAILLPTGGDVVPLK